MKDNIRLNQKNLGLLPKHIPRPTYDRSKVKTGIVHIGVGGFHRAHEAFYTDQLLAHHHSFDWGICGIALLERDRKIYETLRSQDGLYTLMVTQADGSLSARIIGSIVAYLFAPGNPQQVIRKIADPSVRMLTLTITEGGYNFDPSSGAFQLDTPDIQWDLNHPKCPRTVFGYVAAALQLRRKQNLPLTIQSCDNIQQNGEVAKNMFLSFMKEVDIGLADWVENNIAFPNSMVDRITPATSAADKENLLKQYGIVDEWPVITESFYQWVIEDRFTGGRPAWDLAGAQFVPDVHPYEKLKIRLVNGGHSLLGLTGYLAGYEYIDEAAQDPSLNRLLKQYMDMEVTPILDEIPGVDLNNYKHTVAERFANPFIKDNVRRIMLESSAKIPKFILPTIEEQLMAGGPLRRCVTVVAAWYCYLELIVTRGDVEQIEDAMSAILVEKIKESMVRSPLIFLEIERIFGKLAQSDHFRDVFLQIVGRIRKEGILSTIELELE